ncbi:helix-turn-helix domain-containing protein [Lachnoclostridium sp. Marseille-P6806]|uniref:helix-turn-helix domain-containing protein n=1 Tax=Lachnoclostridium sp. Marseille-P6806 TaxID=2364793 RepID=UPI00102F6AC2|nr:helix-turn-helix domain-containing protein [Lachnoclostridium sp. Marseille-P6806]
MYRILIADDEGIAIDSLTFIIHKAYGSKCELRSAKTGRGVIETAESFRPDIAVMDIQMPGIGGIEAMKEIRRFCPDTVFIVLTAYDKFDYAKEAIELGVYKYLTKPLDRDVFVDTMNGAMAQIDREKERRSNTLRTWEKLETVIPLIESGLVCSLLLQESYGPEIDQYRSLLDIRESSGFMLLIECGESEEAAGSASPAPMANPIGTGIRIQNCCTRIREIVKDYSLRSVVGQIMANKIPVFIPHSAGEPDYSERVRFIEQLRQMIQQLEDKTGARFRIGIGTVKPIGEMRSSYQEALRSLHSGTEAVSHADDLPVACEYEKNYPIELENTLFDQLRRGLIAEAEESAERFFAWMQSTHAGQENSIRLKALEFVLWGEHLAFEDGGMGLYRFTDRQDYLDIARSSPPDELRRWFVEKLTEAAAKIAGKTSDRTGSLVGRAKDYIDAHYHCDISLDDVSRELDISPYYFSKLFKEGAGLTFIEYLTTLRMNRAKELLSDPAASIRDVGQAVGYQDPNYFSRLFKRQTGQTPSEFRGQ